MKILTIKEGDEIFQVKIEARSINAHIEIYSADQKDLLYFEHHRFQIPDWALRYANEFNKRQAIEIVKRYLRYEKNI